MLEKKTELGDIRFSRNVILKIVDDAADSTDGNVLIQNFKGKYISVMPGNNVIFRETEDGVEIEVFVVVRFGASISKCCKEMIDYIKNEVSSVMGEKSVRVKIIVTGVQSNETARRYIEFTDTEV